MGDVNNPYGYCPHCGADVATRTRGMVNAEDTCVRGHRYPSAYTLSRLASEWVQMVRDTLAIARDELEAVARGDGAATPATVAAKCRRMLDAIPCRQEPR